MLVPTLLAAVLAAVPALAQDPSTTSAPVPICRTTFAINSHSEVPTLFSFISVTSTVRVNVTTQDTITVTPNATTLTTIVTEFTTVSTTVTSTPPAVTVKTSDGFLPLLVVAQTPSLTPIFQLPDPTPSPVPRYKRGLDLLDGLETSLQLRKRQTAEGNTAGVRVNPDGTLSDLDRGFPREVRCNITSTATTTSTSTITLAPTTVTAPQLTLTALATTTSTVTTTITEVLPRATKYAACGVNNVVDHVIDSDNNKLVFNEVIYKPQQGFPVVNELKSNATSAENCCIACQKTNNCAGSFYFAYAKECRLRLTVAPVFNNGTTANVTQPSVCSKGSNTLYLGIIFGAADWPDKYALAFSNGPCGRFSWSPVRHNHTSDKM